MAATVEIVRLRGASGATVDTITSTTTRLKQADNGTQDANNPVPAAGTLDSNASLSCWCVTRLNVTAVPSNSLGNLQWWYDGVALATGLKIRGESATAYVQAPTTGLTFGSTGELKVANYSGLTTPVDLATTASNGGTYTAAAKKSVAGSWSSGTVQIGDRMVYQLQVASTAAPGTVTLSTFTWSYDET